MKVTFFMMMVIMIYMMVNLTYLFNGTSLDYSPSPLLRTLLGPEKVSVLQTVQGFSLEEKALGTR